MPRFLLRFTNSVPTHATAQALLSELGRDVDCRVLSSSDTTATVEIAGFDSSAELEELWVETLENDNRVELWTKIQ